MSTVSMILERAEQECTACHMAQALVVHAEQDLREATESVALRVIANELLSVAVRQAIQQRHHQFNFHEMPGKWRGNTMLLGADGQQADLDERGQRILGWIQAHEAGSRPAIDAAARAGEGELSCLTREYLAAEHTAMNSYHQLLRQRINMAYRGPVQ